MHKTTIRTLLAALGAALLVGASGPAAQEPADPSGGFGEVIDVRVINIEVVVTDKEGERVVGLGPETFRLVVDGVEVPIEFFTEIRSGIAMSDPGVAEGMELAPGTRPGEAVETSYLLFIDEFFAIKQDRDVVLDKMAQEVAAIGPGDRVAVVAFDGRDLEMLSSWTDSAEEVQDVLRDARKRPSHGLQRIAEQNRFDDTFRVATVSEILRNDDRQFSLDNYLTPEERFFATMLAGQVQRAVQAAAATLRGFASPPGRKVMLLASGGWPFLPSDFVVSDIRRSIYDTRVHGGSELFSPLTETANRLGYTIYPIDVPGMDRSVVDASTSLGPAPFRPGIDPVFDDARGGIGREGSFVREQEVHYALQYVADQTGGRALLNSGRLEAFQTAREDTRSYYWLGFTPAWQGDDSYHDVEVELVDPALKVRSRGGFMDLSRQLETTMVVESSLLFGTPSRTDSPLKLVFGRPEKAGHKKMNVPLRVEIPLDEVIFLPTADGGRQARLELRVAVIDARGAQAEIPVIPLFIDGPGTPEPGATFNYELTLKMRRESHRAVVAIYDQASGGMLSGTAEISP